MINLWINSWIKPFFRCHNLWRTGRRPYLTAIAEIFLFRVRYTLSRLSNHVRCYHVASKTPAKISDRDKLRSSVSRKIIYATENFGMARISIFRVPKTVVRIACLLPCPPPQSNFGTAKSSFGTSFGLNFLVSILRNHCMVRMGHCFIQTWRRKSIRWVPPHKKRTSGTGIWSIWSTEVNKSVFTGAFWK